MLRKECRHPQSKRQFRTAPTFAQTTNLPSLLCSFSSKCGNFHSTHRLVAEVVDDAAEEDLLADEDRDVAVRAARPVDARVHDVLLREARLRRRRRPRPPHAADAAARTLLRGRGRGRGRDAAAALVVAAPVILPARTCMEKNTSFK